MSYFSPKIRHAVKIIGLAVVTMALAAVIVFFFPKLSHAPLENTINVEQQKEQLSPSLTFDSLKDNDHIKAEQMITGKVAGYWFFEGSFPVALRDINGNTFATVIAKTNEDWMVTQHVNFYITMPATFSYTGVGSMLLKKDDPSDGEAPFDPEKDQKIIPVIFENE